MALSHWPGSCRGLQSECSSLRQLAQHLPNSSVPTRVARAAPRPRSETIPLPMSLVASFPRRPPMGILLWLLFGLLAGAIAKFLMPGKAPGGILLTIVLGIIGAVVGGFIGTLIGF